MTKSDRETKGGAISPEESAYLRAATKPFAKAVSEVQFHVLGDKGIHYVCFKGDGGAIIAWLPETVGLNYPGMKAGVPYKMEEIGL